MQVRFRFSPRSWRARRVVLVLTLLFAGLPAPLRAQERSESDESLERRIEALERQLAAMQQEHSEEIEALKAEIARLREGAPPSAGGGEDELAALRRLAAQEAGTDETAEAVEEDPTFTARGLSLQSLNPEISITGDLYARFQDQEGVRERSDFRVRGLGLHLESYLDPYSRFKAAVPISEEGAELGEAYFTRFGLPGGMSATFGKFRQQFGVINRWHKHALDQFDFPLPLRQIFGPGGLNQTGMSLDWSLPPLGSTSQGLTFQLTGGHNPRLFDGNTLGTPSMLLHYKNFQDLSKDTYLELGATGLVGWRDEWSIDQGGTTVTEHDSRATFVGGLDCDVLWEPTDRMRYRNLEWRTELYFLDRGVLAPDGSGSDTISAWGAYSYLQTKMSRTVDVGVRFDYFDPDQKAYAGAGSAFTPHALVDDVEQWQVGPYLTWFQSPWVHFRVEYDHVELRDGSHPADVLIFQLIFAAGPHKHERY